jgi:hypothetical protein
VLVTVAKQVSCNISVSITHLQVLFGGLLPLLGHGAGSDGVGKHARESEQGESSSNAAGRDEEDLAALTWRRRSAGTVGTKGDVVCCRNSRG